MRNPIVWTFVILATMLIGVRLYKPPFVDVCAGEIVSTHCWKDAAANPELQSRSREPELIVLPSRTEWRAERALKAQVDTARYTLFAVMVSFGGLALSIVGVYLLRMTLQETRRTLGETRRGADAAREANAVVRATESARFSLNEVSDVRIGLEGENKSVNFNFVLKNIGRSAADSVQIESEMSFYILENPGKELFPYFDSSNIDVIDVGKSVYSANRWNLAPQLESVLLEQRDNWAGMTIVVKESVIVRYTSVFSEEVEKQFHLFGLVVPHDDDPMLNPHAALVVWLDVLKHIGADIRLAYLRDWKLANYAISGDEGGES